MSVDLDTILWLADHHGFPVLPLCRPTPTGCSYPKHAPCPDPGKKPITYAGVHGATTDPEKIRRFWRWYPDANLGLRMGAISGYFVLEADGPKGRAFLRSWHLPPTPTVVSRRGPHVYLRIPPGYTIVSKVCIIDEVDVKGDRGYVVGPGSRHRTGHLYQWQAYLSLGEIEPAYPSGALISWLAEHGILRRGATQISAQARRPRRAPTLPDRRDRPTSQTDDETRARTWAGGFKTIVTSLLETCGTPLGKHLAELARKPDVRDVCLDFLALDDVGLAKVFLCRLPGHREGDPSAVLKLGDNDHVVYEDLHATHGEELEVYTLVDYYRAHLLGRVLRPDEALHGPVLMPWWERLLVEAGYLEPVPVPARVLPADVPASVQRVYSQFLYLCGCKWIYEPGAPTTFAVRFGMEWCRIGSHHTFREALRWLLAHGYILELPPIHSKAGQRLAVYLPSAP